MTNDDIRAILRDKYGDDSVLDEIVMFENPSYSTAVIGISDDDRLIYDYGKMIEFLMDEDGMDMYEAIEFIDFNTIRAIGYQSSLGKMPIIMYGIDE